ncbi:MAG: flagellar type III secretion system pore protein FliP [Planctomycetales bacterium]|nr:flagellar type III secretion system pore protein FliP [Planctomycetales bacterium]
MTRCTPSPLNHELAHKLAQSLAPVLPSRPRSRRNTRRPSVAIAARTSLLAVLLAILPATVGHAQSSPDSQDSATAPSLLEQVTQSLRAQNEDAAANSAEAFLLSGPEQWTSREGLSSSLQILLLLTVLSLAPAILLMTTCYVRIIVVLGLLRQALGTGQLPPSQVMTSISLFMTLFIMAPVWTEVYDNSLGPYTAPGSTMSVEQAWEAGIAPVADFMSRQIDWAGNHDDVFLFYSYYRPDSPLPNDFSEVPLRVLLPAYMLSELKTAFLIGFQIFLPFLLIDLVVASVTISMGMMMLPPAMISLPFKLLLFVLIDGWHLVVGMLLESFGTYA